MHLSSKDLLILSCIQFDAERTIAEIATLTGLRSHSIQYAISQFKQNGIIRWMPFINVHVIGLSYYMILFSISKKQKGANSLPQVALQQRTITWFAELSGAYQYGTTILATSPYDATIEFEKLLYKSNSEIVAKSVAIRTSLTDIPRDFLKSKSKLSRSLNILPVDTFVSLSDSEQLALDGLQRPKVNSYREAGLLSKLPLSTFESKIKALKEKKVLSKAIYAIDPYLLGLLPFKLVLNTNGHSRKITESIRDYAENCPHAYHFVETFGEWDYEINIEVQNPELVTAIIEDLYFQFSTILHSISTFSILKVWKFSRYFSISEK
jgi:DNA-binding Lrp family transcriptional regulator